MILLQPSRKSSSPVLCLRGMPLVFLTLSESPIPPRMASVCMMVCVLVTCFLCPLSTNYMSTLSQTPVSSDAIIRRPNPDLTWPLSGAFQNTTLNPAHEDAVLDLCAKYRPVVSLNTSELGTFTIAEATFPVLPGTRPVDRPPCRPNPRTSAVMDKCVADMPKWGIIEKRLAKKNGSPRFCVDFRRTLKPPHHLQILAHA